VLPAIRRAVASCTMGNGGYGNCDTDGARAGSCCRYNGNDGIPGQRCGICTTDLVPSR